MTVNNTRVLDEINTIVVCPTNTFVLDFAAMKYGERLRLARKNKNYSQTELAAESGVGQGTISKIERGDQETSTFDIELAHALDVDPMWLKTGEDKFAPDWLGVRAPQIIESNAEEGPELGRPSKVPVVGTAQLGDNGNWTELEYPVGFGDGYVEYSSRDANAYAIRCIGNSMSPRIKDGEFVIVEPNTSYTNGDEVMVKALDGRVMVKTYLYTRDNKVYLISVNEAYPQISIPLEQIEKIHFVGGITKKALWRPY
jgi:phage repressor protein C with HTH and peptisase S24 domain